MKTIWLLTGSTENWLNGIKKKCWAFPDTPPNKTLWGKINPGDIGIFHATRKSAYWHDLQPSILGYGVINQKAEKETLCWDDEIKNRKNKWPLVISFESIFLSQGISRTYFEESVEPGDKSTYELSRSGIKLSDFRKRAQNFYPEIKRFMDQKSLQELDQRYEFILNRFEFSEH
jgi:hypothetical protein